MSTGSPASGRPFYVTTPIYYINGRPHLGHAYTTVACDAIARYMRVRGRDVRFLTGTDEHGQKALKSAEAAGITPKELADRMVVHFREAWKALEISHDDFIRTTEERHVRGVQELWRRMAAAGDVYRGQYTGWYCVTCEAYYPESQLVDGKCPELGHPVERLSEDSWFFRLSAYRDRLLELYRSRPDFVLPATRMNEVVSFVEMGLDDLSISRRIPWGVPVPDDPDHVMYVWVDALSNYVTALGFGPDSPAEGAFSPHWPADLQVMSKDILRFHCVYWPAFLMSAGLEPPKQVLCHGWWLKDGAKMSKSAGNVADPMQYVAWFGADAVRYFLLREIALGADGNYSDEAILDRYNTDLANDLGNTLSRITKIVATNLGGVVPPGHAHAREGTLRRAAESAWPEYLAAMDAYRVQDALRAAWSLLDATNKHLVVEEPWHLAKEPARRDDLAHVMHDAAEALRHVACMLAPVMPTTAREIWRRLAIEGDPFARHLADASGAVSWGFPASGPVTHDGAGLFPRLDKGAFFADVRSAETGRSAAGRAREEAARVEARVGTAIVGAAREGARGLVAGAQDPESGGRGVIQYEDFAKVQLMAARVRSAKRHPDAEKLLVLEVDDGDDAPRTICAGIAAWYRPEDLEGKTVAIVANLAPRKLRGIASQGMLLAASWKDDSGAEHVRVVELSPDVTPGSEVR